MMRPTQARINRDALKNNLRVIRSRLSNGCRIMAVVKANCYGHDMAICLPEIINAGIDVLAVATVEEGARLRELGVESRIAVMTPPLDGQYEEFPRHRLEAFVSSARTADALSSVAISLGRPVRAHFFVDTGMTRNGARAWDTLDVLRIISQFPGVEVTGFASHFATSDEQENPFARRQLEVFDAALRSALDAGFAFNEIHIANSGGIFNFPDSHYTMVRPGLSLYGYHPTPELQGSAGLVPVMSIRTIVANITHVAAGVSISYGGRYFTSEETRIATLPIGYADGLMRILTNRLDVLIGGRRYPVVGTICMDEVMVDLGGQAPVEIGEEALITGVSGSERIDAWELAENAGSIPYEICTNISSRVPRVTDTRIEDADTVAGQLL